ncbi:hypothetical protein HDV03_003285 [Kappamyces sp. JEL0829]|nr:hypothetical protein HDV03_003285 [Kappamyces sp. JEL0829]
MEPCLLHKTNLGWLLDSPALVSDAYIESSWVLSRSSDGAPRKKQRKEPQHHMVEYERFHRHFVGIVEQGIEEFAADLELLASRWKPSAWREPESLPIDWCAACSAVEQTLTVHQEEEVPSLELHRAPNPEPPQRFIGIHFLVKEPTTIAVGSQTASRTIALPGASAFLVSSFARLPTWMEHQPAFDFILMDPPWPNASVNRSRAARYDTTLDIYDLFRLPIKSSLASDGIVGVWVTNKPRFHRFVLDKLFPAWGLRLLSTWVWIKIAGDGKLLFNLDNNVMRSVFRDEVSEFQDWNRLELFGREVRENWTVWGNEPLKFNDTCHVTVPFPRLKLHCMGRIRLLARIAALSVFLFVTLYPLSYVASVMYALSINSPDMPYSLNDSLNAGLSSRQNVLLSETIASAATAQSPWSWSSRPCSIETFASTWQNWDKNRMRFWKSIPRQQRQAKQNELYSFINALPTEIPVVYKGRGVIYSVYPKIMQETMISVQFVRRFTPDIPIEIWHNNELQNKHTKLFSNIPNVSVHNLADYGEYNFSKLQKNKRPRISQDRRQYELKAAAILHSSLDEILFLDGDSSPVRDVSTLFAHPAFKETGAVFWKDFWKTSDKNPIWDILGIQCVDEFQFESGQMVVRKSDLRVWRGLQVAMFFLNQSAFYFDLMLGDKDAFRYAFRATKSPYHLVLPHVSTVGEWRDGDDNFSGVSLIQYMPTSTPTGLAEGEKPVAMFLHANLLKDMAYDGKKIFFKEVQQYLPPILDDAAAMVIDGRSRFLDTWTGIPVSHPFSEIVPGEFEKVYQKHYANYKAWAAA